MSSKNRIDPLSFTPSIARQTPDNEFGTVLARTLGEGVSRSAGLLGSISTMSPVASAALASVRTLTGLTGSGPSAPGVTAVGPSGLAPGGSSTSASVGNGASTEDLLKQMSAGGDGSSMAYLQLQMRMQAESQQFSAVSNILKVRSDSAKAAINNIR